MNIRDIITLGQMGFSRQDIIDLMGLSTPAGAAPATPAPVPAPPAVVPTSTPVVQPQSVETVTPSPTPVDQGPDVGKLLAGISARLDKLETPNAGGVGQVPQQISIEDVIRRPFAVPTVTDTAFKKE